MTNKFHFPKGSLSFKKIVDIDTKPKKKISFKEYYDRKKFADTIEKLWPHGILRDELAPDLFDSFDFNKNKLNEMRTIMNLGNESLSNRYEITLKHPKWCKVLGEIKVITSKQQSVKDGLLYLRQTFKNKKDEFRKLRVRSKTTTIRGLQSKITYNVSGGCIYMPNTREGVYLKFLKDQEKKIVFSNKYPKESGKNYVGIELEFLAPIMKEDLGNKLYDIGVGRYVTLKDDGSIKCMCGKYPQDCEEHSSKLWSHELCIIAMESEFKDIVIKVCKLLNEVKAEVNKSCGMHVHIDCRNRDPEKVYQNLMSSQSILLRMNPKSRTEKFSKETKERDFAKATSSGERYYAVNALAFATHKTIEVRVHSGTVDSTKINNWIDILVNIGNTNERYVRKFNILKTFCKRFNINDDLKAYIEMRIAKFISKDSIPVEAERGVA